MFRWRFLKPLKILVSKILLSPIKENIECPKALPRCCSKFKHKVVAAGGAQLDSPVEA